MKNTVLASIILLSICINTITSSGQTLPIHNFPSNWQTKGAITIYVDNKNMDGPWKGTPEHPYKRIQDGVNNASDGDIIYVSPGEYQENIVIDKSITLSGDNKNTTIIDGRQGNFIIQLLADNIEIRNFSLKNSGGHLDDAGILVKSNNVSIKNCCIHHTKKGIFCNTSSEITVQRCSFLQNGDGIHLQSSANNLIDNCSFIHNVIAVNMEDALHITLFSCTFSSNGIAIYEYNTKNLTIQRCNISDNSPNKGGIFLTDSFNTAISKCVINHNGVGVSISSSKHVHITNCTFHWNTHYAISFRRPSTDVLITYCDIANNLRLGVYIEQNNNCTITKNHIVNNTLYGIYAYQTICDARNNWWGSPLGPANSLITHSNKLKIIPGQIHVIPWKTAPVEKIGAKFNGKNIFTDNSFTEEEKTILFSDPDADIDGVPDWWEKKWGYSPDKWDDHRNLDPDHDGLTNIEECFTDQWGSNPFQKDIFLEIDWMTPSSDKPNKPSPELLDFVIESFKNHNISLHVDLGEFGGGEEIPDTHDCIHSYATVRDIYWTYFLHNDPTNPRKGIFHYGLICNYCHDLNFPFVGWDHLDSFAISAEWLSIQYPSIPKDRLIVGALVHHLGHTLGLIADSYGGIDNLDTLRPFSVHWYKYLPYKSCMNYFYKFKVFSFSNGSHGPNDFNDWKHLDFTFFKNGDFSRQK